MKDSKMMCIDIYKWSIRFDILRVIYTLAFAETLDVGKDHVLWWVAVRSVSLLAIVLRTSRDRDHIVQGQRILRHVFWKGFGMLCSIDCWWRGFLYPFRPWQTPTSDRHSPLAVHWIPVQNRSSDERRDRYGRIILWMTCTCLSHWMTRGVAPCGRSR